VERGVKILGDGEAPAGLKVRVHRVSRPAREKIERAGGTIELIG
jgi:large subunit ribosomal protein L15